VGKAGKNILWTFGEENTVTITAFLKKGSENISPRKLP
jgi:hypothetical protein